MSSSGTKERKEKKSSGISAVESIGGILFSWVAGAAIAFSLHVELVTLISFGMQYVVFLVHALPNKSEHFYDFAGGLGNFTCIVVSYLILPPEQRALRNLISTALGSIWAFRLGSFLFDRIRKHGRDTRFNYIKLEPLTFFMAWSLQGLWIQLTVLPIIVLNGHTPSYKLKEKPVALIECIGWAIFIAGFLIEATADYQKSQFRSDPANKEKFISHGLWAWSRHPNYFGEISLWCGMTLSTTSLFPINSLPRWLTWVGPAFVVMLLTTMSGIPMLERQANKKWGKDPEYIEYKKNTHVLLMFPPKSASSKKDK